MQPHAPKVLVVDDSWTNLALMAQPLQESGFDVITATDGQEALERVVNERPDCVVLDVVLPKLNGYQVCRRIKQSAPGRNIPVILVSSKASAVDKQWGLRQGADAYLTKPFRPDELIDRVRRATSG